MLTVGSLFSGIGGLDLGLERAGMRVLWQCESDPYCRAVLRKHWPGVPCYEDVKALLADSERESVRVRAGGVDAETSSTQGREEERQRLRADALNGRAGGGVEPVDILAGGFPCQPVSLAGRRRGAADERWLWPEFARLIRVLRPRYALMENVPGLLAGGGMAEVLGDLAACGYDAEWDCIPAASVGAPHLRYRVLVVAYPNDTGLEGRNSSERGERAGELPARSGDSPSLADPDSSGRDGRPGQLWPRRWRQPANGGGWLIEPDVGRVAHGVPSRVDRLRALGNAVVPQVAEWIGRQIVAHAEGEAA